MKKIEKLTPKQEIELKEFRDEWFKIGTCTEPANRALAEKSVRYLYEKIGKKAPVFEWFDSPYAAEVRINEDIQGVKGKKLDKSKMKFTGTWFWGAQEAYWISFYLFCEKIGVKYKPEDSETLHVWADIAKSCTWVYPYENVCLICERPTEIHMNAKQVLHKEGGPSVTFKDGFSVYSLNGVLVPKYLATTPGMLLDVKQVLGETNVDVRREGLRKIPLEKIIKDTNAKELDSWVDTSVSWCEYTLYDLDFGDNKVRKVLRMKNPSIPNTYHMERVEDDCTTVRQALAWRNGQEGYMKPEPVFYDRKQLT